MHLATLHELRRQHFGSDFKIREIIPEAPVELPSPKRGRKRIGKFDFLVNKVDGGTVGLEVLTRPSKGKLLGKLPYASSVDQFIFVLPHSALSFYRKPLHKYDKKKRPKKLPALFRNPKLRVWLFDLAEKKFYDRCKFNQLFYVE